MARPLRDYQLLAEKALLKAVATPGSSSLFILPTGTGKTRIATALFDHYLSTRILVIAHRKELIEQMASAIHDDLPHKHVGVVMAETNELDNQILVGSKQTLGPRRLEELIFSSPDPISLIFIDEAHHVTAKNGYWEIIQAVRARYPLCCLVGCTATAYRSDKSSIFDVLPDVVFERSIEDMQVAGWLCPLQWRPFQAEFDPKDFYTSTRDGEKDYNVADLEHILLPYNEQIARHCLATLEQRPTVIFCASVAHAHGMTRALNDLSAGSALTVWGEMPKAARAEALDLWKSGGVQFICNVGVLTEGFDYQPTNGYTEGLAGLVIARPTMAPGLYLQMLGRGTRPKPPYAMYQDCIVIDVVGNANLLETSQISLPRVIAVPDTEHGTAEEIERAKKKESENGSKPRIVRITDPLARSWVAWTQGPECYHTSLGSSTKDGVTTQDYAVLMRDPKGSGLYYGFLFSRTQGKWNRKTLSNKKMSVLQLVQHTNKLIGEANRRSLVDKDRPWRFRPGSIPQLNFLKSLNPGQAHAAMMNHWNQGQVSAAIDWGLLEAPVSKTRQQMEEKL